MRMLIALLALPSLVVSAARSDSPSPSPTESEAARKAFAADVLPLLRRKCIGCHGEGKELEGRLDLRTRAGMLKGGERGPVLVPGKPEKSRLYQSVLRTGKPAMPPEERNKLTPAETEALRKWIAAGAPWDLGRTRAKPASRKWDPRSGVKVVTSGGLSDEWTNRKYRPEDLWAYRPIQRVEVPEVAGRRSEVGNRHQSPLTTHHSPHPIDAFIRAKLSGKGLKPAPAADRRTLVRRLTIGLTGLPPSPPDVEAFLKDSSTDALHRLVNRLLASKHYGEQQARHWLDVVRYADTSGFSNDYERPNAWRYRDYVIRSFNADKPFDRFVVEQLAGDELDPHDPELLIAAGFLRMGPWEHTGMSVAAVTRQQYLDDVTNAVGVTFLAQGLRCAQCHDHKFDPIPTRDYYRIQSVFAPVQFADRDVPHQLAENIRSFAATRPRVQRLLNDAREFLLSLRRKKRQAVAAFLRERGVKRLEDIPEAERPQRHYGLTKLDMSLQKIYQKRVDYFQRELERYEPLAFSVYSGPFRLVQSNKPRHLLTTAEQRQGAVEPVRILAGGNLATPADAVTPGVLSAVALSNDRISPTAWNSIPNKMHGRRLAFARWVASPNNTLTARVIVNRIWQQHFGTGIVETPNNFGKMGGKPSHPELLDWLATWFIEHGWSLKKLHRLIVTSETYRQSSAKLISHYGTSDPKNRLLAFFPPRRLAAEELRDAMLAVTGELNPETGGPGVYPEINWEVARQPRHIMGSVAPSYQPSPTPRERNRRTIYAFRYRTLPDPLLEVFNKPLSNTSCERRDETTVTPQVFALFNGQFAHDRTIALAAVIVKQTKSRDEQVRAAFRRVYGRDATKDELRMCTAHVERMTAHHRRHKPVVVKPPTSVRREMIEELTGEQFTWTEPLDQMKRYQPDRKPWDVDPETRALAELCLVLLNSNEFVYVR